MNMQVEGRGLGWVLIAVLAFGASNALAQSAVDFNTLGSQTLDRTSVFNSTTVVETDFGAPGIDPLDITASPGLTQCQLGTDNLLFCLDGLVIKRWLDPATASGAGTSLATCADSKLGLDTKKPADTCPAMTVDQAGAIWISGKKGSAYNLIKLTPNSVCDGAALNQGSYCYRFFASSGRVADLVPIDGDALASLTAGTLGVQNAQDLVFFSDNPSTAVKVLVPGRNWKLASQETVLTAALLPLKTVGGAVRTFALVSTSQRRVLAVELGFTAPATFTVSAPFTVFTAPNPTLTCSATLTPRYTIRAGKSRHVYLTDRNHCLAYALQAVASGDTGAAPRPFKLNNAQSLDLTASNPPDGVTVAPGIIVDFADCDPFCAPLEDAQHNPALKLYVPEAKLVGSADTATLFQVKGLLDCRWAPAPKPAFCAGSVLPANAAPQDQYLNITPQLPPEIKVLYPSLPPLLMSPRYRAITPDSKPGADYTFDALFFKPQTGLKFNGSFQAEYFVDRLTTNTHACENPSAQSVEDFRKFDVVTQISETWLTVGAPNDALGNVDMLINSACGSTYTLKPGRLSLFPINLELTKTDDKVLTSLLTSLSDDWEETRARLACAAVDGPSRPLAQSVCTSLQSSWANMDDKLEKCVQDLTQNSNSAANCNSFQIQFGSLKTAAGNLTSTTDPANRVVELQVRLAVMEDLYYRRVLPSYLP